MHISLRSNLMKMIFFFISFVSIKGITNKLQEEALIVYNQELFTAILPYYAYEDSVKYSIIDSNCDTATIQNTSSLNLTMQYPYKFPDPESFVSITDSNNFVSSTIVFSDYQTLLILMLNLLTGEFSNNHLITVQTITNSYNSIIAKTLIINDNIFILVQSTESLDSLNLTRNRLFYMNITDNYSLSELDLWDLRYLDNLQMGDSDSSNLCFSTFAYDSIGSLFIYDFTDILNPILFQCFLNFELQTLGNNRIMKTLDLILFNHYFVVLQENAVIVYTYANSYYSESFYANLTLYGTLYSLSYLSSQASYLANTLASVIFSVNSESGLILLDASEQYEKALIHQFNVNEELGFVTSSQICMPYILSTNFNDSLILQYSYQTETNEIFRFYLNITGQIKNANQKGAWIVIQGYYSSFYIRQDYEGISLFQFNLTLPAVSLRSDHDCYVSVNADASVEADESGTITHILFLIVVSDTISDITLTNGYNISPDYIIDRVVYFDQRTEILQINLTQIVSGWNLNFSFYEIYMPKYFNIEYSIQQPFSEFTFILNQSFFKAIYLENNAYLLNSTGILMYGVLFLEAPDPLDIDFTNVGDWFIAVLFDKEIRLYYTDLTLYSSIPIDFECNLFKGKNDSIICANNTQALYLFGDAYRSSHTIADANFVVDASYYEGLFYSLNLHLILTDKGLWVYNELGLIDANNYFYPMVGNIILLSELYLYVFNPGIKVYSLDDLSYVIKTIPIPELINKAFNYGDILFLETDDHIYIVNAALPVLSCVVKILDNQGCTLMSSQGPSLMILCEDLYMIYNFTENANTDIILNLSLTVTNISKISDGFNRAELYSIVQNEKSEILFILNLELLTYRISLFFDSLLLINDTTSFEYDISYKLNIGNYIHGYNIHSSLFIEDSENAFNPSNLSLISNLYPSVYESASYSRFEEFIDYASGSFTDTEYLIGLTNRSLIIMTYRDKYPELSEFDVNTTIRLSSIFNQPLKCYRLDLITRIINIGIFSMSCSHNESNSLYFDGEIVQEINPKYFLAIVSISFHDFSTNATLKELPYKPTWTKPITFSRFVFSLILIDQVLIDRLYDYNNHMIILQGVVGNNFEINLSSFLIVNYFTLGIDSMYAVFVDGVYDTYINTGNYMLKLYVADLMYGIRIIQVSNGNASYVGGLPFENDPIVSLSICGNILIVLTKYTNLMLYTIQIDRLSILATYPPSPITEYFGTNSLISCNDYYKPKYISLYLCSDNTKSYKLRIIDLDQSFNNTLIFELAITNKMNRIKSLFITNNSFIVTDDFSIKAYYINDPYLFFPELSSNNFSDLADGKSSFTFRFKIRSQNALNISVDSPVYYITRIGPKRSQSDEIENSYNFVYLFGSILLILVTVASVFMYKALAIREKRRKYLMTVGVEMSTNNYTSTIS